MALLPWRDTQRASLTYGWKRLPGTTPPIEPPRARATPIRQPWQDAVGGVAPTKIVFLAKAHAIPGIEIRRPEGIR